MNLEFNETLDGEQFGRFRILLQSYVDYDIEDEDNDLLYNVAIEFDGTPFSYTLDIFESYDQAIAELYYRNLIDNIKRSIRR